jgi:FCD domain
VSRRVWSARRLRWALAHRSSAPRGCKRCRPSWPSAGCGHRRYRRHRTTLRSCRGVVTVNGTSMTPLAFERISRVAWRSRFHRILVSNGGWRLIRTSAQLSDHAERYSRTYLGASARRWSRNAVDRLATTTACEREDADEAVRLLSRHLSRTALSVIAMIAPEYDPVRRGMPLQCVHSRLVGRPKASRQSSDTHSAAGAAPWQAGSPAWAF